MDFVSFIIGFLLTVSATNTDAAFLELPATQNVNAGDTAAYRCKHDTADIIRWRVNGSLIGRNPPPDVTSNIVTDKNGDLDGTLTIVAHLEYNQTEIVCVARFDDGSPEEITSSVLLIIHQAFITLIPLPPQNFSFLVLPSDGIFPSTTEATFCCQHPNATSIIWRVNGTVFKDLNSELNISFSGSNNREGVLHTLTIPALSIYNGTTVECIAKDIIGILPASNNISSPSVTLLIQGPLSAVQNISRYPQASIIRWIAPFSLNITNAEPDIVYCIDITNITCDSERKDPIISMCGLLETYYYNESILNKADLFEISITPKSNAIGSEDGISNRVRESYVFIRESDITPVVRKISSETVTVQISVTLSSSYSNIAPDIFTVSLESVNGTVLPNFTSPTTLTANTVIFDIKDVPYGDLWYCRIYASRCSKGILVSEITSLSTFDFQNVKFSNNQNGVLVSCDFIEGSEAVGILIIAYSVTDSSNIHYGVIQRKDQDSVVGGLSCLSEGEYNVLLFVIRDNGIPHSIPAQFPKRRDVSANTSLSVSESADQVRCVNESESVNHTIDSRGDNTCIQCYESCIIIVHQNITSLNSMDGLLNISLVHQVNKNADDNKTAPICINETDSQTIIVIPLINGGRNNMQPQTPRTPGLDNGTSVTLVAGVITAAVSIDFGVNVTTVTVTVIVIIGILQYLGVCLYKKQKKTEGARDLRSGTSSCPEDSCYHEKSGTIAQTTRQVSGSRVREQNDDNDVTRIEESQN